MIYGFVVMASPTVMSQHVCVMNQNGRDVSTTQGCYFDELHIRARSPWHKDQYNQRLEAAKASGLSNAEARAQAILAMQSIMGDSGIRRAAR